MPGVEFDLETNLDPAVVRCALLDFIDRRPHIWPSIEPSLYEVYSVAENSADIKEGSKLPGTTILASSGTERRRRSWDGWPPS